MAAHSSLYNEDRNLLRIREKERRNQEAHQEKEASPEKAPLFAEPYKTAKGDELSSRIQTMLGDYEEMKEFLSSKSHPHRLDGSEDRPGKPRYPLCHDRGSSSAASTYFRPHVYHQPIHTSSAPGSLSVGNISHSPKMAQPRMEPVPSLHAKIYSAPDGPRLTQDRFSQGPCSRKCDQRADGDSALERKLSPLISSLPSPVPPLSPVHSRLQGASKAHSSGVSSKSCCTAKSSKDLVLKAQDKETPLDSLGAVTSLGAAPQPPCQTFPPPPLPSKSVAMQQKPTAYVRPMDGQDQAPSESPELKLPLEDYSQQSFEKPDLKVPAKAKLTRLRMPSQSVEQPYSNEVHCVEEILKEMTHSWPPPLTAIHTPSTAEPSRFPFPTKEPLHISSTTQSQKQYDTPPKPHPNPQQGTSMLEDDLQLSDSEDSDTEQAAEKRPCPPEAPSAPQTFPGPVASTHSSSAESESSESDTSSDSESESSSSDSEENEPLETRAPEPEPPTTNKWQLDNWLTKVNQPSVPSESRGSTESPRWRQESKGVCEGGSNQQHPDSKDPPLKSSSKALRGPSEWPQPGKRSCSKSPARQEPPPRQTVGSKQPRKSAKGSSQSEPQASSRVESEAGPLPYGSKEQTSKDKPKVKTKGRPRAVGNQEPKPEVMVPVPQAAVPKLQPPVATPSEKRKHKSSTGPSKPLSGPEPPKDSGGDRNPEHSAFVSVIQSQGSANSGRGSSGVRTSGCRQAVIAQEDGRKDKLLLPLRDTKLLSPLRDSPPPTSLVVKITLDLLTRIPQPLGKGSCPRKAEDKQLPAGKKQDSETRSFDSSSRVTKKRKSDPEKDHSNKRIKLDKSQTASSSSSHTESFKTKTPRPSSENSRKEMLPPPPVSSSSSSSSSQKPSKPAHKRPKPDADICSNDLPRSASSAKSSYIDSFVPKHRKVQARASEHKVRETGPSGDAVNPFSVPSLPNGNAKPGKPQVKSDRQQADFHMKEAKKLKCKAEATVDKAGKAFKYLEAVLSFIECGMATESESSAKSAYTVYSETVDLIKFIMSLKSFSDNTMPAQEKIFTVLCLRCQALLNMAMFRCKKDTVMKYSRTLSEHFKSTSRVAQAPSPCMARSTGVPSPLSPMPSPASSVGSQSSAGSSLGTVGVTATVSTPVTIQNMTSSYVTITSHVLKAFSLWEQAEALTRKNKEFFAQLSSKVCVLALNSSLVDLVHYVRQGLQRLKQAPKAP
ncbi:AF4/FMR2 family member 1 isoform X2 [Grammomys surdaster]|uniref:AF4/FMR2 family member 1 isoform X2 n=1 Tax=Grammomys surdaster TaxID=491861 RepID=UPI0010A0AF2C|nr:AF4/FMR2 family member 1 isoform X2 [Grammomys surdaster]